MMSMRRVMAVTVKEFRHLQRDRLTIGMIAGIPIILTLLFGYAINTDVRNLSAGVVDAAQTSQSRELVASARASQVIDRITYVHSVWRLEDLIKQGKVSLGLIIPADFEDRLARGKLPIAQILVNDSDPTVLQGVNGLANLFALSRGAVSVDVIALRPMFNPERRTAVFIVPGLCGVILTLTMVLFTSVAIVRERELGTLELLIATPVRPVELMVGKIVPYVLIGIIQITIILIIGKWLFTLPIRGSLGDFYLGSSAFILSVLSLGLFISTAAGTQFQAFQMTFVSFLPQLLLSGFMFPFEGMPRAARLLAELFPLTHYLRVVRGVVVRGAELELLWPDLWPLLVFFMIVMGLATMRFNKRLS